MPSNPHRDSGLLEVSSINTEADMPSNPSSSNPLTRNTTPRGGPTLSPLSPAGITLPKSISEAEAILECAPGLQSNTTGLGALPQKVVPTTQIVDEYFKDVHATLQGSILVTQRPQTALSQALQEAVRIAEMGTISGFNGNEDELLLKLNKLMGYTVVKDRKVLPPFPLVWE